MAERIIRFRNIRPDGAIVVPIQRADGRTEFIRTNREHWVEDMREEQQIEQKPSR